MIEVVVDFYVHVAISVETLHIRVCFPGKV
jgi:hypothetical protein